MHTYNIAVLPGDGIGPEVTAAAVAALRRVAEDTPAAFEFQETAIGGAALRCGRPPLPPETLALCLRSDAVLLGAVGDPAFDRLPPAERPEAGLLQLRQALGCFANLRPVRVGAAVLPTPFRPEHIAGVDLVIVRELLGGLYFGKPRGRKDGRAWDTMAYSEPEVEQIARLAFQWARARRRRVTSVDKANVLECSQLWRAVVTRVAAEFPDVELEHQYVDACALTLNLQPRRFDILLTENTFGDILSDQAAAFRGSLGMLASASLGARVGLFEPVHGSAPALAGKDLANPMGAVLTAALLLRHALGLPHEAGCLEAAVEETLADGIVTADFGLKGGAVGTRACGAAILERLQARLAASHAYHAV